MIVETKLILSEYVRVIFILTYRKPWMIFISLIGLLLFVGSLLYFAGLKIPADRPPYFQLLFGFYIIALLPFSVYRSAKKQYASNGRLQEKITYEFTEDKIKITGETFNSELNWEKTYKIVELNSWILIYQNRLVANVIPIESFGNNLDAFRSLIKSKTFIKQKLKN